MRLERDQLKGSIWQDWRRQISDTYELELALEKAKRIGDLIERQARVTDAQNKLYRAQKREFETSLRRRAKLNADKP